MEVNPDMEHQKFQAWKQNWESAEISDAKLSSISKDRWNCWYKYTILNNDVKSIPWSFLLTREIHEECCTYIPKVINANSDFPNKVLSCNISYKPKKRTQKKGFEIFQGDELVS